MPTGFQIPQPAFGTQGAARSGFGTPTSDTTPQVVHVLPRRVIPIVFLPGIMGSNLRIKDQDRNRIDLLGRKAGDPDNNIAWRPDDKVGCLQFMRLSAADRQRVLDPETTEVDVYNPDSKTPRVDGDGRHSNVELDPGFAGSLLSDDLPGATPRHTGAQKARARGWGEVYFGSYGGLLQRVELRLQRLFSAGKLVPGWEAVIGVEPKTWGLDPSTPQGALTENDLRAITKDTFFPVHAVGYNWLQDNRKNAKLVGVAIRKIVAIYKEGSAQKHDCPGVIVVTHSMGGLLGRALIHPDMGGLQDLVLGIVHGVQPATGAAAGYARMHAGFEDPGLVNVGQQFQDSMAAKVAGNYGDEVTAVLANSVGGLQLLPSKAYGNGWLRVQHKGRELMRLPTQGDPYEEIYKLRGKWYGLFPNEAWLNPGVLTNRDGLTPLQATFDKLDAARKFHEDLADVYHPHTYAHYGADVQHRAFGNVTWQISPSCDSVRNWSDWRIVSNTRQGTLTFFKAVVGLDPLAGESTAIGTSPAVVAKMDPPDEAGDQTVPMRSADRQRLHGKCKAIFRQTGYDHQGSYKNEAVLAATLFSILKIAQRVQVP